MTRTNGKILSYMFYLLIMCVQILVVKRAQGWYNIYKKSKSKKYFSVAPKEYFSVKKNEYNTFQLQPMYAILNF